MDGQQKTAACEYSSRTVCLSTISSIQMMPGRFAFTFSTASFISAPISGVSGRAGAKHDLKTRVHVFDRADEMNDAFLPRDPSDKEQEGFAGIDPVFRQRRGGIGLSIFLEIDPVMDHVQPIGPHFEEPFDVRFGFAGDGDDGIRHFQARSSRPRPRNRIRRRVARVSTAAAARANGP